MAVTEEGIVKEPVKPEPVNAQAPMVVTEEGRIKESVKPSQL
jgi:hypothetical protein